MFETAWSVFGIGMVTIFLILGLVVLSGNLLIWAVNRFAATPPETDRPATRPQQTGIDEETIAVLVSAVEWATRGQGRITHIQEE
ncbi:MAG: OadG family protein [Bacteroidota bacterium]